MQLLAIIATLAVTCASTQDDAAWSAYKTQYNKVYATPAEEATRYATWRENVAEIEAHNSELADLLGYTQGVNQFTDMADEEFTRTMLTYKSPENKKKGEKFVRTNAPVPNAIDWRKQGYVTPVKNQGQCGSCYAFSATGALEAAWKRKTGTLPSLSEQQIVDCSGHYGNEGCGGGLYESAWDYLRDIGGSVSEDSYPYTARRGWCEFDSSDVVAKVKGQVCLEEGSEEDLQAALSTIGPIAVSIDASHRSFRRYSGGVYYEPYCRSSARNLDHAVLAVGYGNDDGQDYWLVKNSWGSYWGDGQGYIKMIRNQDNNCGIATEGCYPKV